MTIEGFTRAQMTELPSRLLRDGRAANARVTCVTWQGREWTVKDFSPRNWWVRTFLAPFLLGHEFKILQKLTGLTVVASDSFVIALISIAIAFFPAPPFSHSVLSVLSTPFLLLLVLLLPVVLFVHLFHVAS